MQYVFVVSYGRSGSTLLTSVLNAIPGYCIRGENGGIMAPMAQADRLLRAAHAIKDTITTNRPPPGTASARSTPMPGARSVRGYSPNGSSPLRPARA